MIDVVIAALFLFGMSVIMYAVKVLCGYLYYEEEEVEMKSYIEIRFVVNHLYVAGTHNKPVKIKFPKELLEALKKEMKKQ